jgi:hypothetical protein
VCQFLRESSGQEQGCGSGDGRRRPYGHRTSLAAHAGSRGGHPQMCADSQMATKAGSACAGGSALLATCWQANCRETALQAAPVQHLAGGLTPIDAYVGWCHRGSRCRESPALAISHSWAARCQLPRAGHPQTCPQASRRRACLGWVCGACVAAANGRPSRQSRTAPACCPEPPRQQLHHQVLTWPHARHETFSRPSVTTRALLHATIARGAQGRGRAQMARAS